MQNSSKKNEEKKSKLFNEYKSMKNELTKQIRCSKKAYYNEYFSKNSKNIKKNLGRSKSNTKQKKTHQ